ncbi:hypothetical protein NDU88_002644 [Pleurodeles waltl]|uniref:Uncharacterized protein n=1 Tax=Pleurodeles waltl TaxID=8319 RepID=A0AAV7U9V1_PLEWA|nr:hypothetical protein NDU88_002644 [Pleurodeles waltl]
MLHKVEIPGRCTNVLKKDVKDEVIVGKVKGGAHSKLFSKHNKSKWESKDSVLGVKGAIVKNICLTYKEEEQAENDKVTTVRKKQKKRNAQPSPATHPQIPRETKDLQWDYTNTQLEEGSAMHVDIETQPSAVSLETIYQSIMEHREEFKTESCRTQLVCRKMQTQIRRVAKTCSEFATRIGEAETRISRLEDDVVSQRALGDSMEKKT